MEHWQAQRSAYYGSHGHPLTASLKAFLLRIREGLLYTTQLRRFLRHRIPCSSSNWASIWNWLQALPLASMRQVKARLRQYSLTRRELIWRKRLQVVYRRPMLPVAGIAQCDQRGCVDEDHGRTGRRRDGRACSLQSLRRIAERAARRSWTS